MACGLTHIRRGTASTLKKVNNTRFQVLGNFILKREKRSDSSGGAENKSSIEMRESVFTKAIDLGADLERMYSCEWKAEIDYFLGNRLDRRFRIEGIVQKSTSNAFKHVRRETIKFE